MCREHAALRSALAEAHTTIVRLEAQGSSEADQAARIDNVKAEMEAHADVRVEAAVEERTAYLRAQLTAVAAELVATKQKVLQALSCL